MASKNLNNPLNWQVKGVTGARASNIWDVVIYVTVYTIWGHGRRSHATYLHTFLSGFPAASNAGESEWLVKWF